MGDNYSPWTQMGSQPSQPAQPAKPSGTDRDYGNMLNAYYGKPRKKKK
jgi:hypothetical protein